MKDVPLKSAKKKGGTYMYARCKLTSPGTEQVMLLQYRAQHELQNQPRTRANILLANLHGMWSQHISTKKKD